MHTEGWRDVVTSPDELPAVEAEGGLWEKRGHELVSVDLVDPASDSPLVLPGELLMRLRLGLRLHRLHNGII